MNSEKNKKYSAAEIQKYISGEMSVDEMYEIEKAALNDPFLSDAIEGYQKFKYDENEITLLRKKIYNRKSNSKIFRLSSVNFKLMSMAASLLIIVIASYFLLDKKKNEPLIAENDNRKISKTTDSSASSQEKKSSEEKESEWTSENNNDKTATLSQKEEESALPKKNTAKSNDRNNTDEVNQEKKLTAFKDTRDNDGAKPKADVKKDISSITLNEDSSGSTAFAVTDAKQQESPVAATYVKSESMEAEDVQLNEVAVNSYQNKRKKSANFSSEKISSADIIKNPAKNSNSDFDMFRKYVLENKQDCSDNYGNLIHGTVKMSFKTDHDGTVSNIKVVKSLNEKCDKEAERLLLNGPIWKNNPKKKLRVDIEL